LHSRSSQVGTSDNWISVKIQRRMILSSESTERDPRFFLTSNMNPHTHARIGLVAEQERPKWRQQHFPVTAHAHRPTWCPQLAIGLFEATRQQGSYLSTSVTKLRLTLFLKLIPNATNAVPKAPMPIETSVGSPVNGMRRGSSAELNRTNRNTAYANSKTPRMITNIGSPLLVLRLLRHGMHNGQVRCNTPGTRPNREGRVDRITRWS